MKSCSTTFGLIDVLSRVIFPADGGVSPGDEHPLTDSQSTTDEPLAPLWSASNANFEALVFY